MKGRELLREGASGLYFITKNKSIYVEKVSLISDDEVRYDNGLKFILSIERRGFGDKRKKSGTIMDSSEEIIKISEIREIISSEEYNKVGVSWEDYFLF